MTIFGQCYNLLNNNMCYSYSVWVVQQLKVFQLAAGTASETEAIEHKVTSYIPYLLSSLAEMRCKPWDYIGQTALYLHSMGVEWGNLLLENNFVSWKWMAYIWMRV